jgi:quinol monooxygenase YgiN
MKAIYSLLILGFLILVFSCVKKQDIPADNTTALPVADSMSHKMITAMVYVKSERVADFIEAARAMIDSSNAEPGCISYQLYQNPYDNTKFIFVEAWKDQAAIDTHFSKAYFKAFGPITKDWLLQPSEIKILDVVSSN